MNRFFCVSLIFACAFSPLDVRAQIKTRPKAVVNVLSSGSPEAKKLAEWMAKTKTETEPAAYHLDGGFVLRKQVGSDPEIFSVLKTDFVAKPFVAVVKFKVLTRDTKIYPSEGEAKNGEWLPAGRLAGQKLPTTKGTKAAKLYFTNGDWALDEMDGRRPEVPGANAGGIRPTPIQDNPWWKLLGGAE